MVFQRIQLVMNSGPECSKPSAHPIVLLASHMPSLIIMVILGVDIPSIPHARHHHPGSHMQCYDPILRMRKWINVAELSQNPVVPLSSLQLPHLSGPVNTVWSYRSFKHLRWHVMIFHFTVILQIRIAFWSLYKVLPFSHPVPTAIVQIEQSRGL